MIKNDHFLELPPSAPLYPLQQAKAGFGLLIMMIIVLLIVGIIVAEEMHVITTFDLLF